MVTILAGLFEPFVFPSQLLWLGWELTPALGLGVPSTVLLTGTDIGRLPTEHREQRKEETGAQLISENRECLRL